MRYAWDKYNGKYLYKTEDLHNEGRIKVPYVSPELEIFVDILETKAYKSHTSMRVANVRLFFPDGNILIGWTLLNILPCIRLWPNTDELFDGRFNSNKKEIEEWQDTERYRRWREATSKLDKVWKKAGTTVYDPNEWKTLEAAILALAEC